MSWTEERIERLKKMWHDGATASQIADELGGVSRNAVIGKAHRLGLQSRPSPVKPNDDDGGAEPAAPAVEAEAAPWEAPAPAEAAAAATATPAEPEVIKKGKKEEEEGEKEEKKK
jgi:GcrA cell cycle regulator